MKSKKQKMSFGPLIAVSIIAAIVALVTFTGVQIEKPKDVNTDPQTGPVFFDRTNQNVYKVCDGTTLVYVIDKGGSAVANSSECRKK